MRVVDKVFLFLFIGVGVFFFQSCDNNKESKDRGFVVTQNFEVGKLYRYEVQKGKFNSSVSKTDTLRTITDVEFRVVSETDSLKECSWKYGETKLNSIASILTNPETEKSLNYFKGFEVKFLIEKNGAFQRVTNFKECQAFLETVYIRTFADLGMPSDNDSIMEELIRPMYSTPEMLLNTYCHDMLAVFMSMNDTLKIDSVDSYKSFYRGPYISKELPIEFRAKIRSISNDIAFIMTEQVVSKNELNSYLDETYNKFNKHQSKDDRNLDIAFSSKGTLTYDIKNKILREITALRITQADTSNQIETMKVTLKD